MKFPITPYLNQKFKSKPGSSVVYIWTGFAWDISTDEIGNPNTEVSTINRSSVEINGEVPIGVTDDLNREFNLINDPISGTDKVYLNGLRQVRDNDYTIDGKTITFSWAPYAGANILCTYEILNGQRVEGETPVVLNDGVFTEYSLLNAPIIGSEKLYINGLRARYGESFDYTIEGTTIKINYPLDSYSRIICDYNY